LDMEKHKDNYCVILAGGKGRRLWPCSRDNKPKQFLDFFGLGRTQLQATYDRFAKIVPGANILVCTNRDYEPMVREQLPDLPASNVIVEPINRNTAPCVGWAVAEVCRRSPEASIIVTPSDQLVLNEEAFAADVERGLNFVASHDTMLSMGVRPSRPEPGYGYIQLGEQCETEGVFTVRSFTEKPEREFAKVFMESGEFYWNTGLFLSSARNFYREFTRLFSDVHRGEPADGLRPAEETLAFVTEHYQSYPNLSIDCAVLERSTDICVMKCDFGWADLGTWHSIYECMRKDADDNVVIDSDVMMEDCRGNVVKMPKGKLAVINGLDGYIVADGDDVLLICKKGDSSALVRKYVNKVQMEHGNDYL
jgi:mannose-1-phosphate guanylyltransferase